MLPENIWMALLSKARKKGAAAPVLQDKEITENGTYTADEGFDGLGSVLVNIASGGSAICKTGQITATTTTQVIQHNLGVVPSFFFIYPSFGCDGYDFELVCAVGISQATATASGITKNQQYENHIYSSSPRQGTPDYPIDTETEGQPLCKADESTITVGNSTAQLRSGTTYTWIATGITE